MKTLHYFIIAILMLTIFVSSNTAFAQVAPTLGLPHAFFKTGNAVYPIQYNLTNGRLVANLVDLPARELIFRFNATGDGQLTVELPRDIIDSTRDGKDKQYLVFVDDMYSGTTKRVKADEIQTTNTSRTLTIDFTKEDNEIGIVATYFVENKSPYTISNQFGAFTPLQQYKKGFDAQDIICKEGLVLIIKSEDDSPACVKQDTVKKLVERGWAGPVEITSTNESHKFSSTNQTLVIGNDTYDITEFQFKIGNSAYLDNVKFVYHGTSPVYTSCYPEFINQTEARDFEIIPSDKFEMNISNCWPFSNYPQNMTKENVFPSDLFSRYAISFFDINQTTGVGWCHSNSCDLGKTIYLVKKGWNTPIVYDDPVSLEFHLNTNASVISVGQAIGIDMSTSNNLSRSILVPNEYHYSFNGTGLGPCTYGPFSLAILEGYFGENNFTHGNELSLYQPGTYSCPAPTPAIGYKFEPMSNNATTRCDPFFYCDGTQQIQYHISFSGFWKNNFNKFKNGIYTIIGGDEWNHHMIQHFTVVNPTERLGTTTSSLDQINNLVNKTNNMTKLTVHYLGGSGSLHIGSDKFNQTVLFMGNVGQVKAGLPVQISISDPYDMFIRKYTIPSNEIAQGGSFIFTHTFLGRYDQDVYTLDFSYSDQKYELKYYPIVPP